MKNSSKWKVLLLFVVGFLALFFLSNGYQTETLKVQSKTQPQTQKQEIKDQDYPVAPAFSLNDVNGKSISLEDYKGQIVFINFWATWCPPCRAEIPDFVKLIDTYGSKGFVILGISVDSPQDQHKIPGFMDEYNMNYPVLLDGRGEVAFKYGGIEAVPTTFVLDREGKALGKIVGMRSYQQFEQILKQVL